jgi:multiple sugar transport system substrate-binding protein
VRRKLLTGLFAIAFILSTLLTACGSGNKAAQKDTGAGTPATATQTTETEQKPEELKADLTFWIYPQFEKADQFFNDKVTTEFKKEFPGVNVATETIPWDGGPNKVNVAIASGSTPDMLWDTPMRINGYAEKGVLVDVDEELKGIEGKLLPGMTGLVGGKNYIIPISAIAGYTFTVNTTLAKELGTYDMLPKDYISWTQEDFKNFIKACTDKGKSKGIYGTALWAGSQSSDAVYFSFLMSAGAKVFNDEDNKIILNSPEAVKSLDLLGSMVKEGIVTPGASTLKDEDVATLFFNKKIVVEPTSGLWVVSEVEKQLKSNAIQGPLETELYEIPSFDGKSSKKGGVTATGICVFENNNEQNKITAVKEYAVSFLMNDSLIAEWVTNSGHVPVRPGLEIYKDAPMTAKEANKSAELLKNQVIDWGNTKPYWSEIRAIFYPEIQAVYTGSKTAQQALENFVDNANKIVSQNEK